MFQNFLRDQLHAGPLQLGGLESTREIPGLLCALTAGTLAALAETHIAALGLLITAVGIGLTGNMSGFGALVGITVFWSVGFHLWASMQNAITLALARGREGGRHLGRMSGIGSTATLIGLGFALTLTWLLRQLHVSLGWNYKIDYYVAGVSIGLAALLCSRLSARAASASRVRIVLRREYGLYYLLIFLEGCRRQIFSIFASFALILVYHVPVWNMLILQFVNAIMISLTAPAIGKVIDRRGERSPLAVYSVGLIVVFLGYATFRNVTALYALFLFDNVLFSFGVGFTTYIHRIARPGELTACLSMGVTMNHIAAVTVPVGGAWLWKHSGNYQLPFWIGVSIACIALVANQWLPKGAVFHEPTIVPETPPQEETAPIISN